MQYLSLEQGHEIELLGATAPFLVKGKAEKTQSTSTKAEIEIVTNVINGRRLPLPQWDYLFIDAKNIANITAVELS